MMNNLILVSVAVWGCTHAVAPRWLLSDAIGSAANRAGGLGAFGLLPNATESAITFWRHRDASLWVLPQFSATTAFFRANGSDPTCSYSADAPTGIVPYDWVRIGGAAACASGLLSAPADAGSCADMTIQWVHTQGRPPPAGVQLLQSSTTYIEELDVLFAFGGFRVANVSVATSSDDFNPGMDIQWCQNEQMIAHNASFKAPHAWSHMYNISSNTWSTWTYAETGLIGTPNATGFVGACATIMGMTALYSRALNAVVATGAYENCASAPNVASLYIFNLTSHTWRRVLTTWDSPVLPNCLIPFIISQGVYTWADAAQTSLLIWGGHTFNRVWPGQSCFRLNVTTGHGALLASCSYGNTAAPPSVIGMAVGVASQSRGVVAVGGTVPWGGQSVYASYFSQSMWLLDVSTAGGPAWSRVDAQIESMSSWTGLNAAVATLVGSRLWRVASDDAGDTFVAWGGIMANASLPQLLHNWDREGRCAQPGNALWPFTSAVVSAPHVMHVIWVPAVSGVVTSTRREVPLAAAAVALAFAFFAAVAACATVSAKLVTRMWKHSAAETIASVSRLPLSMTASFCANLMIASTLVALTSTFPITDGSFTSSVILAWCAVHAAGNTLIALQSLRVPTPSRPHAWPYSALAAAATVPCAFTASLLLLPWMAGVDMSDTTLTASTAAVARARALATQITSINDLTPAREFVTATVLSRGNVAQHVRRAVARNPKLDAVLRVNAAIHTAHYTDVALLAVACINVATLLMIRAESGTLLCYSRVCLSINTSGALALTASLLGMLTHLAWMIADRAASRVHSIATQSLAERLLRANAENADSDASADMHGQEDTHSEAVVTAELPVISRALATIADGAESGHGAARGGVADPGSDAESATETSGVHDSADLASLWRRVQASEVSAPSRPMHPRVAWEI